MATFARVRLLLATSIILTVFLPSVAGADARVVDCAAGRRIGSALRMPAGRQLLVIVKGTCTENVAVARDDVTLRGDAVTGGGISAADPARATVLVDGRKGVVLDLLTVSGGQSGITGTNGAVFAIQNSTVEQNVQNGIVASVGSAVTLASSRVRNNGASGSTAPERAGWGYPVDSGNPHR
ncbi:MAG: hypothetical protein HYU51_10150 [Candidatus Rokubacteria bacterium]|nr:hypothetical protein [Candidatus Rokubacteria bacterium]